MTLLPTPLVPMATEGTGGTPGPCDVMAHVVAPRDVTADPLVPMATEGIGGTPGSCDVTSHVVVPRGAAADASW